MKSITTLLLALLAFFALCLIGTPIVLATPELLSVGFDVGGSASTAREARQFDRIKNELTGEQNFDRQNKPYSLIGETVAWTHTDSSGGIAA